MQHYTLSQTETQPQEIRNLLAGLQNGGYTRCPSCYNWIDHEQVGAVSLFPASTPIAFALCRSCALDLANPDEKEQVAARIVAYFGGEVDHD